MKKTRLFKYLNALNNKEWNSINDTIINKYHIKTDVYVLFQFIFKYKKNLNHQNLEITYVQKAILKGKTKKTISNTCSLLTDEVKKFLISSQLSEDHYTQQLLLLKAMNQKGLHELSNQHINQVNKKLDSQKIGLWNSLHRQLFNHHYYFSENPKSNKAIFLENAIKAAGLHHQQLRSLYKFETQNSIVLNKTHYNQIHDDFEMLQSQEDELSFIFTSLKNIVENKNPSSAEYIERVIFKRSQEYSSVLQLIMYIVLRGFYSKEVNRGKIEIAHKMFELQKFMIDNKYILHDAAITSIRFITIVSLSAFIGETKWGREFVHTHGGVVIRSERNRSISIAEALLLFSENKYAECIRTVNQIYAKSSTIKSILNRLELIAYIELYQDNKIFLMNRLDNYRLFNLRNKKTLSHNSFKGSNNLYKILTMIVNGENKDQIKRRMQDMEIIFYRLYLHSKLDK